MGAKDQKSYWKSRVRKRTYQRNGVRKESSEYYAFIQWDGKRKWVPLGTGNQDTAASTAARRYITLTEHGWDGIEKKSGGDVSKLTVGEFIEGIEEVSKVSLRSWGNYIKNLRQIVGEVRGLTSPQGKKFTREAAEEWQAKVNETKLSILTPEVLTKWTKRYVRKRDKGPESVRRARNSCNTILRNAKALFKADLLEMAGYEQLNNPFLGVKGYSPERSRYQSNFDAQILLEEAQDKLGKPKKKKETKEQYFRRSEAYKALLIFGFTALRRGELDLLIWEQVELKEGYVDIKRTRYFEPKAESSIDRIPLDEDAIEILKAFRKKDPKGEFVLRGPRPRKVASHSSYRCEKTFRYLIKWLRNYKTKSGKRPFKTVQKPLHEIRKEIGALLASHHGIFAAQRFLRHAEIATTERYYSDQKNRVTAGLTLGSNGSKSG